ncbi:MAG: glycolate oxidase subunit GlcE [Gammaproteobacteria bacterium]|nr:glycolate oxidase subunit GlcE [Gammaproteobacteria bacterium]
MPEGLTEIQEAVAQAAATNTPLCIRGGGSKDFYGREPRGQVLATTSHTGIVAYEPSELVITARAGTPLRQISAQLDAAGQMLGFEPPQFDDNATIGGIVASGLSGSRRPYSGSVRDFVLGVQCINGRAEFLSFGGQVMKNVAGYDVSRLMTGALGTLGLITEVSMKVLPAPAQEMTLRCSVSADRAIKLFTEWARQPLPVSGASHVDGVLRVRLSGTEVGVAAARAALAAEEDPGGDDFWRRLGAQSIAFFNDSRPIWRLSVPSAAPALDVDGDLLIDWGGALRWLKTDADVEQIRDAATRCGGHATLFRGGDRRGAVFQPLSPVLLNWHQNLKQAFDPGGIFNPGRMYPEI